MLSWRPTLLHCQFLIASLLRMMRNALCPPHPSLLQCSFIITSLSNDETCSFLIHNHILREMLSCPPSFIQCPFLIAFLLKNQIYTDLDVTNLTHSKMADNLLINVSPRTQRQGRHFPVIYFAASDD